LLRAARPLLVGLLDESSPDELGADDEELSAAEQARIDAWLERNQQRSAKHPKVRGGGRRVAK
jgi:hypothetical protein